jgi:hypothetical protein
MANEIKNKSFFEGGKAIFTVSNASGQHYTFKIRRPRPEMPFFVSMLTGPDNNSSYSYLGIYNPQRLSVYLTAKSKYNEDSTPVKVIRWAINKVGTAPAGQAPVLPAGYAIQHDGRCCRCGRRLTHPESIETGIGPECAGRINGGRQERLREQQPTYGGIRFAPADAVNQSTASVRFAPANATNQIPVNTVTQAEDPYEDE